ncbi:MAG: hypothetical protein OHK0029_12910 [Armatimonadaceae bacterium]
MTSKSETKRKWRRAAGWSLLALALVPALVAGTWTAAQAAATAAVQANLSNAEVRSEETEAGNIVADALRQSAGADIAFVPAAVFRAGATAPRPASAEQVASLVDPATDVVVILPVRGDRVLAALERAVSFAPQASAGFLQVSGIKFRFDPRKGSQQRVSEVTVNGQPLVATQVYRIAMPQPLSIGQQGYFQVWDRDAKPNSTGKTIADALSEYARSRGGNLSAGVEGRIQMVK